MNVLFASAEVAPFAKAGGLADVVGSLPKALRKMGVNTHVLMPMYGFIDRAKYNIDYLFTFQFPTRRGVADVHISATEYDGVPIYFLSSYPYFGDGGHLYTEWTWDVPRYIFFSQAVMAVAWEFKWRFGWFPDLLHVHDWHTALTPFLLNEARSHPDWGRVGSMITIHNMGYQGPYAGGFLFDAAIPLRTHPDLVYQNKTDNLLGIGIMYSDVVTTVSPRYAIEMRYPRFGEGLQGLVDVRNYTSDVVGILNGIDAERWDPQTDPFITTHFNVDNFRELRPANKEQLQREMGLPADPNTPLVGIVSRLVDQKGIDLAIPALYRLMAETDMQLVVLGSGDPALEGALWQLSTSYPDKARVVFKYDPVLSQRIYAGSDLFLMPSRYEPCGTGQMLSLRYGCLPVVRETGGLADTVQNYDNADADVGTGFVFLWEQPEAVYGTLNWAMNTYRNRRDAFMRMQERGMRIDFSWERSAREYIHQYERAIARHR
jgi:starch synthase